MFRKNYVFIGHQENTGREFVFYKYKLTEQELREHLHYLYKHYNLFAIEYYTVKDSRWYKENEVTTLEGD